MPTYSKSIQWQYAPLSIEYLYLKGYVSNEFSNYFTSVDMVDLKNKENVSHRNM